jgi:hypothetical protein
MPGNYQALPGNQLKKIGQRGQIQGGAKPA